MSTGMRYLHWLVGGSLAFSATLALAGEITLYERPNFHGQSVSTDGSLPNLSRSGFNDTASSVIVRDGMWEACTDAYFHGSCVTLRPGEYRTLDATLNDRISSVRQVGYDAGPPRAIVNPPPVVAAPQPQDARVVLSQHDGRRVRSVELTGSNPDLDSIGFADRADSLTVYGGVWRLCDREGGAGNCAEFSPGQYDRLGMLDGAVRSALFIGDARLGAAAPAAAPRVVLYEFPGFRGRSLAIEGGGVPDLTWQRFADRAGSLRIEGGSWMFCTDANFRGECRTLGPGEYARLSPDLDHRISSARLVSKVYIGMR